jgi:phosphoenolpyruvate-protein kinase (PTS system EI component)
MNERELNGLAAAGGVAVGRALVLDDPEPAARGDGGPAEQARALEALERVAAQLGRLARRLRSAGRAEDAEILEANHLMAEDPALAADVRTRAAYVSAERAVIDATERHALILAGLPDPLLAARAADVRRLGRWAARLLRGAPPLIAPQRPAILIARDLGPADVAELTLTRGGLRGIALAGGAATSHVAIMARALGLPMVVGLGERLLDVADGERLVLDGERGTAVLAPTAATLAGAQTEVLRRRRAQRRRAATRGLPAVTRDGREIRLLCNAASAIEVAAGLAAGAEGLGLLRTELAFLEASRWPDEAEHAIALAPMLASLSGRVATVRTLDFGEDKTPPFLTGVAGRGLALTLAHPEALAAQLRALLRAGAATRLRVLLPLVEDPAQLREARALLATCLTGTEWNGAPPALGAMIESPTAAGRAEAIAAEADFISIGTNDLVQYTLGVDRQLAGASARSAADPAVLRLIAGVVEAAHRAGRTVEVCGEAAGEPPLVALLAGLGVDELSVAPARLDDVRATVREIAFAEAAETARTALATASTEQALTLAHGLLARSPDHDPGTKRGAAHHVYGM